VEIKCQLDTTEVFIADQEQAIRSAIKTSVAFSWHFISTRIQQSKLLLH